MSDYTQKTTMEERQIERELRIDDLPYGEEVGHLWMDEDFERWL